MADSQGGYSQPQNPPPASSWYKFRDLRPIAILTIALSIGVLIFAAAIQWAYIGVYLRSMPLADLVSTVKLVPEIGNVIALVTVSGAILTLLKGISESGLSQTWKRKEFVTAQMQGFFSNPQVSLALAMLDSANRKISLASVGYQESVRVDHDLLSAALVTEHQGKEWWTGLELLITDIFDGFLDRLSAFNVLLEAGVITKEDLSPYLNYWLEKMFQPDQAGWNPQRNLIVYIREYGYADVQQLAKRFGYGATFEDAQIQPFIEKIREEVKAGQWAVGMPTEDLRRVLRLARSQAERRRAFDEMNAIDHEVNGVEENKAAVIWKGALPEDLPFYSLLAALEKRDRGQSPEGSDIELDWKDRQAIRNRSEWVERAERMGIRAVEWEPVLRPFRDATAENA